MQSEIEAKFLNVNHDEIRERLRIAGAELEQPMRLMRRAVFHGAHLGDGAYVRVRDEGDRVTITYKHFHDPGSIHGVEELETTVGDFEIAVGIVGKTGLEQSSYQETKRETWQLDDVEIVLDEWPWAPPYIEIEGPSEDAVRAAAERLGFDWQDAALGDISTVYAAAYPALGENASEIVNRQTPMFRFEDPVPNLFKGE